MTRWRDGQGALGEVILFGVVGAPEKLMYPVLRRIDALLDDEALVGAVWRVLRQRRPQSARRGRPSTPAEVVLRLLVLKHVQGWGFPETAQRVADSLVLRWCSRVYFQRVPDATTLLRWAHTIQPTTLPVLLDRVSVLAKLQVTTGRKLRFDGTVAQTHIHHPTDSSLLTDGVRVLSRVCEHRQVIVATRNANIPVLGDAELILALDADAGRSRLLANGGLESPEVADQARQILEGGDQAFLARHRRYLAAERGRAQGERRTGRPK